MELLDKFRLRAQNSLINADEVTDENLNLALEEALEAVANKEVADYVTIDIAYFRLLLICQVEPNDNDYKLYEKSLKIVREANELLSESVTNLRVEQRVNLWS